MSVIRIHRRTISWTFCLALLTALLAPIARADSPSRGFTGRDIAKFSMSARIAMNALGLDRDSLTRDFIVSARSGTAEVLVERRDTTGRWQPVAFRPDPEYKLERRFVRSRHDMAGCREGSTGYYRFLLRDTVISGEQRELLVRIVGRRDPLFRWLGTVSNKPRVICEFDARRGKVITPARNPS